MCMAVGRLLHGLWPRAVLQTESCEKLVEPCFKIAEAVLGGDAKRENLSGLLREDVRLG